MKKFLIFHNTDRSIEEKNKTEIEYEIGDKINVRSYDNVYKCFHKEVVNGELLQHFKQDKLIYTFDY